MVAFKYLSIYLSVYLSVCLSVCLSIITNYFATMSISIVYETFSSINCSQLA